MELARELFTTMIDKGVVVPCIASAGMSKPLAMTPAVLVGIRNRREGRRVVLSSAAIFRHGYCVEGVQALREEYSE